MLSKHTRGHNSGPGCVPKVRWPFSRPLTPMGCRPRNRMDSISRVCNTQTPQWRSCGNYSEPWRSVSSVAFGYWPWLVSPMRTLVPRRRKQPWTCFVWMKRFPRWNKPLLDEDVSTLLGEHRDLPSPVGLHRWPSIRPRMHTSGPNSSRFRYAIRQCHRCRLPVCILSPNPELTTHGRRRPRHWWHGAKRVARYPIAIRSLMRSS